MNFDFIFFLNSILLGIGLAMDAFSVSIANGLSEPGMKKRKMFLISGTFAFFQALMPLIGWVCVHTLLTAFSAFEKFIPYIALALLAIIGTKMIIDGVKNKTEEEKPKVGFWALIIQGIATSIDALSVGFTIAEYDILMVLVCVAIIAAITFALCFIGTILGKKLKSKLSNKATIIGGIILILIGLEIFITGII